MACYLGATALAPCPPLLTHTHDRYMHAQAHAHDLYLDLPRPVDQEVGGFEITMDDGRAVALVQVQLRNRGQRIRACRCVCVGGWVGGRRWNWWP